jgi:hypothetical protein
MVSADLVVDFAHDQEVTRLFGFIKNVFVEQVDYGAVIKRQNCGAQVFLDLLIIVVQVWPGVGTADNDPCS